MGTSKEVRCPFCRYRFGSVTPSGFFHADIKCARCNLCFVVELPENQFIYRDSVFDLFKKRYGLALGTAWNIIENLPVVRKGNLDLIAWGEVDRIAVNRQVSGWDLRKEHNARKENRE